MSEAQSFDEWFASLPAEWTAGCDAAALARVRAAYDSAGRRYHTWDHVVACVQQLGTMPCEQPRPIFLALVFHDAVYVAGRTDNERESAALAREMLSAMPSIPQREIESIERMILATADHHGHAGPLSPDEATMLDIDLSILGAPRDDYQRYANAILEEWVPAVATEMQSRIGRIEFLRRLVAKPHIFLTSLGQARWDERARANIAWEIDELTRQQGVVERSIAAIRRAAHH